MTHATGRGRSRDSSDMLCAIKACNLYPLGSQHPLGGHNSPWFMPQAVGAALTPATCHVPSWHATFNLLALNTPWDIPTAPG